jgi:hypothetical protein
LIGAVLLEQNDEWQLQHRYMQVEAMAEITAPLTLIKIPFQTWQPDPWPPQTKIGFTPR